MRTSRYRRNSFSLEMPWFAVVILGFGAVMIVWSLLTFPGDRADCIDQGGVMVRGDGFTNLPHGYVCVPKEGR